MAGLLPAAAAAVALVCLSTKRTLRVVIAATVTGVEAGRTKHEGERRGEERRGGSVGELARHHPPLLSLIPLLAQI